MPDTIVTSLHGDALGDNNGFPHDDAYRGDALKTPNIDYQKIAASDVVDGTGRINQLDEDDDKDGSPAAVSSYGNVAEALDPEIDDSRHVRGDTESIPYTELELLVQKITNRYRQERKDHIA